jgi:hypothetical protein
VPSGAEVTFAAAAGKARRPAAVSFRAVAIGLLFSAFFAAFTPYNDFKIAATYIAGTQFPIGALFVELVLVGVVNVLLRRFAPRRAFAPGELLTVWTLILVGSGIPSSGMMRYFLPMIVAPNYLSNATNNWEAKVWGAVPDWLKVRDPDAATAFAKGYPRGQEHIPWEAWAGPLFFWSILAVLFLVATFCVASLLRRQWVENEKFTFPLVQLPVLLAEEPKEGRLVSDLLRSPLLWLGVLAVTVFHTVRGLHQLYPSVPDIENHWNISALITTRPLNQTGPIDVFIYPLVIGICYLLPAEVCFSLWFFHLFYKFEIYLGAVYNWDMPGPVGGYTYKQFHGLEAFGGAVALLAWTLWTARRHLADVWEKATNGPRAASIDDSREMLSYRAQVLGIALSYGGIALWLGAAGVSGVLIAVTLLTLTLALVVISWVVCQAGLLFMAQPYGSIDVLATTFGTAPFKIAPLYTLCRWEGMFFYDTREMLAPSVLMGAKCADTAGFDARKLLRAMAASVALSFAISLVASLWLPYYNGGGYSLRNDFTYKWAPQTPLGFLGGAAAVPYKGWMGNWLHIVGGFLGVFALLIARAQFNVGLHPIGFLCASVYSLHMLWASIFVGWVLKSLIQRYGGMKLYLGALPLFLGLILGDVVNAVVWIVIGNLTQVGYQIMPG